MKAFAEIDDARQRIDVHFKYDPDVVRAVKRIPGSRFIPKDKGGPYWAVPLNLKTCRLLREEIGLGLELGDALKVWGREAVRQERNLQTLAMADDADLPYLGSQRPELVEWLRPYQRADIKFMAQQSVINANQPGLGKTIEVIAAVMEAGLGGGQHLVIAPKSSLVPVWATEISNTLTGIPIHVWSGETPARERESILRDIQATTGPFWFVTTPNMVRSGPLDTILGREWASITIDEYHKMGLSNNKSVFFARANKLKSKRRFALSGTPTGGVPLRLWGALHWLDSAAFNSKWQWADQWLEIENNGFGKTIGNIKPGREPEFYRAHAPYLIRRTKGEVLKDLPPKQYVDVWCEMTPKQKAQYRKFADEAEIRIGDGRIVATSVLAEYTRLKQFANSCCRITEGGDLVPEPESGKFQILFDNITDRILDGEQVIVASQSKRMADMVAAEIEKLSVEDGGKARKLKVAKITGDIKANTRSDVVQNFQKGDIDVVVMTTTAGGVSITLDAADSVHILDETWNPDDQEQLEDRAHRASRMHQVTIYYYRSKDSIEEYIHEIAYGKTVTNKNILDIRRMIHKERLNGFK